MDDRDESGGISRLLEQARSGSESAREELFRQINDELRSMARRLMRSERPEHTLQATALVNEACARLIRHGAVDAIENRRHLFRTAVTVMQQVLVDHARKRDAEKRGGGFARQSLDVVLDQMEQQHGTAAEDLEDSLAKLQSQSPRQHEVLTLRFFAGLTIAQVAELLQCSHGTVENDWRLARAKLYTWLKGPD